MNKVLVVLPLVLAFAFAQTTPQAFSYNQNPVTLVPGVIQTTGFTEYVGSQYVIWLPSNVSSVRFDVVRDETTCVNGNVYIDLFAKWGSWPCSPYAYGGLSGEFCSYNYADLLTATSTPGTSTWDAYDSDSLSYVYTGSSGGDFIRGDYLYLATDGDVYNTNCTATINATLTYCPAGTIAAEIDSSDSACVTYTNVTGTSFSTSQVANGPFGHYYLVSVPQNNSGIYVSLVNSNSSYLYIYGRQSTGGYYYNYYEYDGGYGNYTLWIPNIPQGDFVITVEQDSTVLNQQYSLTLDIKSCPTGWGPDEDGSCNYPVNTTTLAGVATLSAVSIPATNYTGDCNWKFWAVYVPPLTYGYLNLTLSQTVGTTGYAYIRKNAFPTESIYDDSIYSTDTWVFTPEDTYTVKSTWYYIGICNDGATAITWDITGSYGAAGPSPVPSASPSPVAAASASASPDADSGNAVALVFSVFVTLAALLLAF
jgi:hypothetical protein